MSDQQKGMKRGLTRYGDEAFSLYLRKAFIKAMGYSDDALARPVIGIANTYSDYNACHANVPTKVVGVLWSRRTIIAVLSAEQVRNAFTWMIA